MTSERAPDSPAMRAPSARHEGEIARRLRLADDALREVHRLRNLLTQLYVAVLGYLPVEGRPLTLDAEELIPLTAWEDMMTTVLSAAEGLPFTHLKLPWPALSSAKRDPDAVPRASASEGIDQNTAESLPADSLGQEETGK